MMPSHVHHQAWSHRLAAQLTANTKHTPEHMPCALNGLLTLLVLLALQPAAGWFRPRILPPVALAGGGRVCVLQPPHGDYTSPGLDSGSTQAWRTGGKT